VDREPKILVISPRLAVSEIFFPSMAKRGKRNFAIEVIFST
jgi:hypothetical protein